MLKFPKPEDYYKLYENSAKKKEYEKLLTHLSNKTTSRDYFTESSGEIFKKRNELHESILKSMIDKYKSSNKPRIYFLLGSIGSGKTSIKDEILKSEAKNKLDFIFINFDDLKKRLPEYELLKKLNPKEAAQFVQSESARLAGKLFKKAIQKKCNIIFEKNIRKDTNGKFQLKEDIMKAVKKNYSVSIHIVFLDSYEEAWKRVEKRAEEIKRFVPKKDVKETFNDLFSNFNILYQKILRESFTIYLWYNGSNVKEAVWLSSILNGDKMSKNVIEDIAKMDFAFKNIKFFQEKGLYVGLVEKIRVDDLPKQAVENLKKLDFFKNLL